MNEPIARQGGAAPPDVHVSDNADVAAALNSGGVQTPTLSVIIPVYNSTAELEQCLSSLAGSDYDDFEVLVVDDGSTEPIEPMVRRYGFRYLRIEGPGGPARARNRGVEQVNGTCVVFIDADVCVHPDTLSRFAARFASDPTIDAVVGIYDDAPAHMSFLSQYKNLFHRYVHRNSEGEISTFWSGCGAMRRDVFLECGWFDEARYRRPAIEDIELGTWVTRMGHRIVLDGGVQCKHLKRWTLKGLMKTDVFDRGIPWSRLILRSAELPNTLNLKTTQRVSVVLVYLMLLSLGVAVWLPRALAATAVMGVIVIGLNFDLYRYFLIERGWWFALRVVFLQFVYFGYCGVGFVMGTLQDHLRSGWQRRPQAPRV